MEKFPNPSEAVFPVYDLLEMQKLICPERLNSRVFSPTDMETRYNLEQHLEWERKMREWRERKEAEAIAASYNTNDDD